MNKIKKETKLILLFLNVVICLESINESAPEVVGKKKLKTKQNYRNRKLIDDVNNYEIETKKIKQKKRKQQKTLKTKCN